jgi:predicted amidohydrolase
MRIATVQRHPGFDDPDRLCDLVDRDLRWAAAEGVSLALFPEGFLLGHSYDPDIIAARAARVSGGALGALCDRTRGAGPTFVIGCFELRGGAIANSAVIVSGGEVTGRYAKAYPNEPGVTAGTDFPVFECAAVRYGINICNDANHPDAAQRIADQGADLILYPLNNMLPAPTAERWRAKSIGNLQARARQTGCWIASADVTGAAGDYISFGCSAIVSPAGDIVARVEEGREGVAMFDIPAMS